METIHILNSISK